MDLAITLTLTSRATSLLKFLSTGTSMISASEIVSRERCSHPGSQIARLILQISFPLVSTNNSAAISSGYVADTECTALTTPSQDGSLLLYAPQRRYRICIRLLR
jgi:hypothetical protein